MICSALINRYRKTTHNRSVDTDIARQMLARVSLKNIVYDAEGKNGFGSVVRRKQFNSFVAYDCFPKLGRDDLVWISFGVYQLEQANYYAYDHLKANNNIFDAKCFSDALFENIFHTIKMQSY